MSGAGKVVLTDEQRCAMALVRRGMHEYDVLASPLRSSFDELMRLYALAMRRQDEQDAKRPRFACCHNIMRWEPCLSCGRDEEDCAQYVRMAIQKLTVILEGLSS